MNVVALEGLTSSLALNYDGSSALIAYHHKNNVVLWKTRTNEIMVLATLKEPVKSVIFSTDDRFAIVSTESTTTVWNTNTTPIIPSNTRSAGTHTEQHVFTRDGRYVIIVPGNSVRLVDLHEGIITELVAKPAAPTEIKAHAAFSKDEKRIIIGLANTRKAERSITEVGFLEWNFIEKKPKPLEYLPLDGYRTTSEFEVKVSEQGKYAWTDYAKPGNIVTWNLLTNPISYGYIGTYCSFLRISPDGNYAIRHEHSEILRNSISLLELISGGRAKIVLQKNEFVLNLGFSPDSRYAWVYAKSSQVSPPSLRLFDLITDRFSQLELKCLQQDYIMNQPDPGVFCNLQ